MIGRLALIEDIKQIIPRDLGAEHFPTVRWIKLLVKRSLKSAESQPACARILAARWTPFGGLSHSSLHLYLFNIEKIYILFIKYNFLYFKQYLYYNI